MITFTGYLRLVYLGFEKKGDLLPRIPAIREAVIVEWEFLPSINKQPAEKRLFFQKKDSEGRNELIHNKRVFPFSFLSIFMMPAIITTHIYPRSLSSSARPCS